MQKRDTTIKLCAILKFATLYNLIECRQFCFARNGGLPDIFINAHDLPCPWLPAPNLVANPLLITVLHEATHKWLVSVVLNFLKWNTRIDHYVCVTIAVNIQIILWSMYVSLRFRYGSLVFSSSC